MGNRVRGKVALVAGAGSIAPGWSNGKAAAVLYAREGAKVFAADISLAAARGTKEIIDGEGGECTACQVEVSTSEQTRYRTGPLLHSQRRGPIHGRLGLDRSGHLSHS